MHYANCGKNFVGLFAKSSWLSSEDPKVFAAFARGFYADWNPVGTTERTLVEMLISARCGLATVFVQDGLGASALIVGRQSKSGLELLWHFC